MAAPAPDQQGQGIAGENFDPFKDQTTDTLVLLFAWWPPFARWLSQFTGFIPFHNYRQWHVSQAAVPKGWNQGAIPGVIVPKIPDCPILWQDVVHYWNFGAFIGILLYEFAAHIRVVLVIVILTLLVNLGSMSPVDALKTALTQLAGIVI